MNTLLAEDWINYEKEVVRVHRLRENVNQVWQWGKHNSPPESVLEEAGYITSYNKHRLKRLADKNNGYLRDCGFDFLSLEQDRQVYCGGQAKYYKDKISANNLGTFLMYQTNLRAHNPKSIGYLYTSSKLQEDLRDNVENPAFGITHILLKWKQTDIVTENKGIQECEYSLREYQSELLEEMKPSSGIIALIIPCGLGKTLIAGHHIRSRSPKLIVAIAPLRASVSNLKERLGCFFKTYKTLLVDSDEDGTTDVSVVSNFLKGEGEKIILDSFKTKKKSTAISFTYGRTDE